MCKAHDQVVCNNLELPVGLAMSAAMTSCGSSLLKPFQEEAGGRSTGDPGHRLDCLVLILMGLSEESLDERPSDRQEPLYSCRLAQRNRPAFSLCPPVFSSTSLTFKSSPHRGTVFILHCFRRLL